MKGDDFTLPLFADMPHWKPVLPTPHLPAMPAAEAESFIWWCQNGNKDMCAAVLRNEFYLPATEAMSVVMTYASPDCAHFARPIAHGVPQA